ncbi:MAG: Fic family protein [Xanthomonadales bacterium]|nr:Fic family protein [Xanthomonadales bacterium]
MHRHAPGRYVTVAAAGEPFQAFVPAPLPPVPPLVWSAALRRRFDAALVALGRLDAVTELLPNAALLLYSFVRKEAVLSSQIEGTQSSLSDLLLFELEAAPGVPIDDVVDVSNYVAALQHGLERLASGFPFSNRLLREVHEILLARGRGNDKLPGEFRRSQNWIGGPRPGLAHFVPPPPHAVAECMGQLERFLHDDGPTALPVLIRTGLAHLQFETIHPFLDGNGRLGRLLMTLYLYHTGVLSEPLLYLSLHFKRHRAEYYRLLDRVRSDGDWEAWIDFFAEGIEVSAKQAVATANALLALVNADRVRIAGLGRAGASALEVHQALQRQPIATSAALVKATGLTPVTVNKSLAHLTRIGIVAEVTNRQRGRVFRYVEYVEKLAAER